jgi:hypothetical protein
MFPRRGRKMTVLKVRNAFVIGLTVAGLALVTSPALAEVPDSPDTTTQIAVLGNDSDVVEVCEGEAVSTLDAQGQPMTRDALDKAIVTLRVERCGLDAEGNPGPNIKPRGVTWGYDYRVRNEMLNTQQKYCGQMVKGISILGIASNLPSGKNELSCIVRISGKGAWQGCGTGVGGSSISTSMLFIPNPPRMTAYESILTYFRNDKRIVDVPNAITAN